MAHMKYRDEIEEHSKSAIANFMRKVFANILNDCDKDWGTKNVIYFASLSQCKM